MQLPSWPVAFPAMLPLRISLEAPPGQLDHLEALSLPWPLNSQLFSQLPRVRSLGSPGLPAGTDTPRDLQGRRLCAQGSGSTA